MQDMLEAYKLKPPATAAKKKPKLRQPRDCSQTVAAAKKKAKAREAAAAKALGEDPEAQRLQSLDERRTGLRNLGATCYMNSLLQTLFMNRAFRRGIFQWRDPDPAPDGGAASGQDVTRTAPQDVASADGDCDGGGGGAKGRGAKDILPQLQMLFAPPPPPSPSPSPLATSCGDVPAAPPLGAGSGSLHWKMPRRKARFMKRVCSSEFM